LASVCAAGLLAGAGTATANHTIDLNMLVDTMDTSPSSSFYAAGHIEAGPQQCRSGRAFRLIKDPNGSAILIDSDRSSTNSFWALGGDLFGATGYEIRMPKKKFGPRENRHRCTGDTYSGAL
jgi:hypothetical protein